jgi:hypothetical protein
LGAALGEHPRARSSIVPWYHHGSDFAPKYSFSFDLLDIEGRDISKQFAFWLMQNSYKRPRPPIPDEVRPVVVRQKNTTKVKYDILFGTFLPLVSKDFKELVEEFAPDEHSFYQIDILDKSASKTEKLYYIMQLRTVINSIIIEKSSIQTHKHDFGVTSHTHTGVGDYRTLRGEVVNGRGVWREELFGKHIFFSDSFYEEYLRRKLSGLRDLFRAEIE